VIEISSILTAAGAMAGIGGTLSLVLFGASRRFKVEEDPRIDAVQEALPAANCGACGLAGCRAFAEAIVADPATAVNCPVSSAEGNAAIASILGVDMGAAERQVARLMCNGTLAHARRDADYRGVEDCRAAALTDCLERTCLFGCAGLGTCVRACPFDAMRIEDGLVVIDEATCTGCGQCVTVCPQDVLRLQPLTKPILVACSSTDKGAVTKRACEVGCIGCKKCVKACEVDAISVTSFCATIDAAKCTACGKCIVVCPQDSILNWGETSEAEVIHAAAVEAAAKEEARLAAEQAAQAQAGVVEGGADGHA
jgi:H+/Na+-translocating ferredoxin:NAD+ oxidoreductase subunit B